MGQHLSNFDAHLAALRQGASCTAREKSPMFPPPNPSLQTRPSSSLVRIKLKLGIMNTILSSFDQYELAAWMRQLVNPRRSCSTKFSGPACGRGRVRSVAGHLDQAEDRVEIRKHTPTASHCAHVSPVVPLATLVGCDEKGDEMHPLDEAREVSVNRGGVLGRVSSAGLIGNAMASANVRQAVAAPSGAAAVIAAKTGTDVRSLTLSAN